MGRWRERFRVHRLGGFLDEPRVGAPRQITDKKIKEVVTKTLESMPAQGTHWSTRLMPEKSGVSQTAIVRMWRAFGLQPHRVENFKLSKDPQFVEKVKDIGRNRFYRWLPVSLLGNRMTTNGTERPLFLPPWMLPPA